MKDDHGVRVKPVIRPDGERCVNFSLEIAAEKPLTEVHFSVPLPTAKALAEYILEITDDNADWSKVESDNAEAAE